MKQTLLNTYVIKFIVLCVCSFNVHASTIGTVSGWTGGGVGNFGEDNTNANVDSGVYATYGQTFSLPSGSDNILQTISFYVNDYQNHPNPINFGIYLYEWNGSNITGSALFESQPLSTSQSNGYEEFTVSTGGIILNTSTSYVVFMSASNYFDGLVGYGTSGVTSNLYTEGEFVYMNNKDDFDKLSTSSWGSRNNLDLAFKLELTSVPLPPSLWLLGSGLVSILGFARHKIAR